MKVTNIIYNAHKISYHFWKEHIKDFCRNHDIPEYKEETTCNCKWCQLEDTRLDKIDYQQFINQ